VNDGSTTGNAIWLAIAIMLAGSALVSRRIPIGQTMKIALAWLAIFAIIYVAFLYRDEGAAVWGRFRVDLGGGTSETSGGTIAVRRAEDGHFWVAANVNSVPGRFLIDSGATISALSATFAEEAGIETTGSGYPVALSTANGTVFAKRATIERLDVGTTKLRDHAVVVASEFGDTNVLGMNFLSSFSETRVSGNTLTLTP